MVVLRHGYQPQGVNLTAWRAYAGRLTKWGLLATLLEPDAHTRNI